MNDYERVLNVAGQVAASRANGDRQGFSSDDVFSALVSAGFTGESIKVADENNRRLDFRA